MTEQTKTINDEGYSFKENLRVTKSVDGTIGWFENLELKDEKETLDKLKRIAKQLKIMR